MNGKIPRVAVAGLIIGFLVCSLVACSKKQKQVPVKTSRIAATRAYEKYFGPAPTTDKGICYAFVIYFPSAREPGKVVPFPFFTFDEDSTKKVAVERLLGGMEVGSYRGEFLQPFPTGMRLLGIAQNKGTVTVNFGREILTAKVDGTAAKAALNALVLTLSQFTGITEVRVHADGNDAETFLGYGLQKDRALVPDETVVAQPSPPRMLSLTAVKDKDANNVEEVDAYFDRPVEVQELSMTDRTGKPFAGDTYLSVFDMAAVLKPKDPGLFQERMPIKVRWIVTDKLGRRAEGDSEWLLEVKVHDKE